MICLSAIDLKTPAHIHYAARRLKSLAPHAKLMLAIWSATDDKALASLQQAVNADYVACSFNEAAALILAEAATAKRPPVSTNAPRSLEGAALKPAPTCGRRPRGLGKKK